MARDAVVKVEILCHSAHRSDVLALLERVGNTHLVNAEAGEVSGFAPVSGESPGEFRDLRANLERTIQFLSGFRDEKGGPEMVVTRENLENTLADPQIRSEANEALALSGEIAEAEQSLRELNSRKAFVESWAGLPCRFDMVGRSGLLTVFAGVLPGASEIAVSLANEMDLVEILNCTRETVAFVAHRDQAQALGEKLSSLGFVPGEFAGLEGTPGEELEKLDLQTRQTRKRLSERKSRALKLSRRLPQMRMLWDAAGLSLVRSQAASGGLASSSVLVLHAWMREKDVPDFRTKLEKTAAAGIEVVEPLEGEVPPVFLTEHATVDPYLLLTDMFGRPSEGDPDPTPLFAPFYALFFGICIGDAGYGAALVLGSALGWWLVNRRSGNTRLFRLIFQGGLASILAGVFLGGWFGMEFKALPPLLQAPAMILNNLVPGYSPDQEGFFASNQFLYLTLGLGLLQLSWGVMVNLAKRLKQGEGFAAVLEQGGWMLAIAGLFPWLFNRYLLNGALYDISGPADSFFLYLLAAGALLIFVMGGRSAGNIGGKVGLGAYAAYGIVNLLGDVLSYSRLFALALSSAIIAQVINEIAGMVAGSIAGIGIVLALLVLVAGHVFNIAMAVLSGFIHTARLQFVEFFGKFYDGTGVPFTPLRYEARFVRIRDSI
jgi:V/A-type H+-transporting ATPase subunit I